MCMSVGGGGSGPPVSSVYLLDPRTFYKAFSFFVFFCHSGTFTIASIALCLPTSSSFVLFEDCLPLNLIKKKCWYMYVS